MHIHVTGTESTDDFLHIPPWIRGYLVWAQVKEGPVTVTTPVFMMCRRNKKSTQDCTDGTLDTFPCTLHFPCNFFGLL